MSADAPTKRNRLQKPDWLLKPPSWYKAPASAEEKKDDTDLFQRAGDCHADIVAAQERRRKAKEEKAEKARLEEEAKKAKAEERKKKHLQDLLSSITDDALDEEEPPTHTPRGKRRSMHMSPPQPKRKAQVIDLDDSDDQAAGRAAEAPAPKRRSVGGSPSAKVVPEADPEELYGSQNTFDLGCHYSIPQDDAPVATKLTPPAEINKPNPTLTVLIDTRIPGTKPLVVKRSYLDNIRPIRKTWCEKQGFSAVKIKEVLFTWRGKRVYDVANFPSLGIELNHRGDPVIRVGTDGYTAEGDKVVFVATTQQILDDEKKAAEEAARKAAAVEEGVEEASKKSTAIRVVLRGKGKEELKISVQPETTFARIAHAYKKKMAITDDRVVVLTFDGDELQSEQTVQDSELEDKDSIEVIIK